MDLSPASLQSARISAPKQAPDTRKGRDCRCAVLPLRAMPAIRMHAAWSMGILRRSVARRCATGLRRVQDQSSPSGQEPAARSRCSPDPGFRRDAGADARLVWCRVTVQPVRAAVVSGAVGAVAADDARRSARRSQALPAQLRQPPQRSPCASASLLSGAARSAPSQWRRLDRADRRRRTTEHHERDRQVASWPVWRTTPLAPRRSSHPT